MNKSLVYLAIGASLSACTINPDGGKALEKWRNYENETITASGVSEDKALAVFYRTSYENDNAINIYVDGDYQGALLKNSYTQIAVCKDNSRFSTSYTTNQKFGNRTQGQNYNLPAQQISYFRLVENNNGKAEPTFEQVSEAQAKQDLAGLKQVTQNLSRVQPKCNSDVVMTASFDASALFAFDKSTLYPKGKADLKQFAEDAKNLKGLKSIERIEVNGYTDPSGATAYNQALSQKRADIVRQELQRQGVTYPITAVGYGEGNLVVANCRAKFPTNATARHKCDQPNRRVEIKVYGTK